MFRKTSCIYNSYYSPSDTTVQVNSALLQIGAQLYQLVLNATSRYQQPPVSYIPHQNDKKKKVAAIRRISLASQQNISAKFGSFVGLHVLPVSTFCPRKTCSYPTGFPRRFVLWRRTYGAVVLSWAVRCNVRICSGLLVYRLWSTGEQPQMSRQRFLRTG